jgi:uncharacterized OB-fold protein
MNDKDKKIGWECPRCGKVNSPYTKNCSCEKKEDTSEEKPWQNINE